MRHFIPIPALAFALLLAAPSAPLALSQVNDPAVAVLLARAAQNHLVGDFSADVVCVRESYLHGRDTLTGVLEVRRSTGERHLALRGSHGIFEWWSRQHGAEQWRREGDEGRPRRLPPHALKKPSFAPDVSLEDLGRLPFGYLDGFRSVRRAWETDSTHVLEVIPGPGLSSLYATLEVTFSKHPMLLRRVVFTGNGTRPSKTLGFGQYRAGAGGYFPEELVFSGADGLSTAHFQLTRVESHLPRDKAHAPIAPPLGYAEPRWVPRDGRRPVDAAVEESDAGIAPGR